MPKTIDDYNVIKTILDFSHYVSRFEDINTVMDVTLTRIRDLTKADAGTFYLVEKCGDDEMGLRFAYVQNDTLFGKKSSNKQLYTNSLLSINEKSIAGYVALTKEILNIPDVEMLPSALPFKFNRNYDKASGYHTGSMLTLPILGTASKVFAVLQLINCKDDKSNICAFSDAAQRNAEFFASQTLPALVRAVATRRLIERMNDMAQLHDPTETGGHVKRVGAYSVEIFTSWARRRQMPEENIAAERDSLRLAAMLHDIGKIGVPERVLKKPTKLDDEEYAIMKKHCALGASIYGDADTPIEKMAFNITLNHHQAWDGSGYTGDPKYPVLSGEDIPIYARIVSVADVFDALLSPRSYKKPWPLEDAYAELKKCAGTKFDPEVVEAMISISETLEAIRDRFPDPTEEKE